MTNPYISPVISGYNSSPPPDNGTDSKENEIEFKKHLEKLGNPERKYVNDINAELSSAFSQGLWNGGIITKSAYTVLVSDRGKIVHASGNVTCPNAALAGNSFMFAVRNTGNDINSIYPSGASGELVQNKTEIPLLPDDTAIIFCDGADWFVMLIPTSKKLMLYNPQIGDYTSNLAGGILQFPFKSPTVLSALASPLTSQPYEVCFSPNGEYMAAVQITTPFIAIYQITGNNFVRLSNPGTLPSGPATACAFSKDGQFLAVGHDTTPFITIYQRSGSTFTKLTDPLTLPTGIGYGCAFSPNGQFLAVAHDITPFITIYEISGTTFTKLTNPVTLPAGAGQGCSFSPSGEFLAVAHDVTPFITNYQISSTTFTKLTNPAILPTDTGLKCSFSPNTALLAIKYLSGDGLILYQISGTTFTKLSTIENLPFSNSGAVAFSNDGKFFAVGTDSAPGYIFYAVSVNNIYKLTDFTNQLLGASGTLGLSRSCAFSPDSRFLVFTINIADYLVIYETISDMQKIGCLYAKGFKI